MTGDRARVVSKETMDRQISEVDLRPGANYIIGKGFRSSGIGNFRRSESLGNRAKL